jgi:hypothetical protein
MTYLRISNAFRPVDHVPAGRTVDTVRQSPVAVASAG